jgi:diacylglycerol kinase family enzyme
MRATLLYNPNSGRANHQATIQRIAQALTTRNIPTTILATEGPNTAGQQALAADTDILFACGGDGTIHEVLQGLVNHPTTTLGIVPLGSANALARHLRLSLNPETAALQQLAHKPTTIPLGHITYTTAEGSQSRYFLSLAGAGPDGALVHNMRSTTKHQRGRSAYYLRAACLFATASFSPFDVTVNGHTEPAVSAMAVRIHSLGGLFSPLTPAGNLHHPQLQLTLTRPPAALSLPAWFALSYARLHALNPFTKTILTDQFHCAAGTRYPVHVQADGEFLGQTPMTVTLIPNALRMLLP